MQFCICLGTVPWLAQPPALLLTVFRTRSLTQLFVIHAGSMQLVADHSLAIMDALFAPFDAASFPNQLNVPQLTQLLEAPFATRVLWHHQIITFHSIYIQIYLL